jgi:hypothetical protein
VRARDGGVARAVRARVDDRDRQLRADSVADRGTDGDTDPDTDPHAYPGARDAETADPAAPDGAAPAAPAHADSDAG